MTPDFTTTTWTDWKQVINGQDLLPIVKGLDYLTQLKIELNTEDSLVTPTLKSLHIYEKKQSEVVDSNEIQLLSLKNGIVSNKSVEYVTFLEKDFYKKSTSKLMDISLQITKNYSCEMDKLLRLMDFISSHTGHGFSVIEGSIDEFSEFMSLAKGDGGTCGNVASVFKGLCNSMGMAARSVSLKGLSGSGHMAIEVWLDTYQKWAFIDPVYKGFFLHKGVPLSTLELHHCYLENRIEDIEIYALAAWVTPFFPMETIYGDFSQKIFIKDFSSLFEIIAINNFGYFKEKNYLFLKDISDRKFFKEDEAYFPINQVEMSFEILDKDTIKIYLKNNAFHFHHYKAYINGEINIFNSDNIRVKLKDGKNIFTISTEGKNSKNFLVEFFLPTAKKTSLSFFENLRKYFS